MDAVATMGSVGGATSRAVARNGYQLPVSHSAAKADTNHLSLRSEHDAASPYLQTFKLASDDQGGGQRQPRSTRPSQLELRVIEDTTLSDVALSPQPPVKLPRSPPTAAPLDPPASQRTVPALSNKGSLRAAASAGIFARSGAAATTAPAEWHQAGEVILAVSSPRTPVSPPPGHILSGGSLRPPNGTGGGRKGAANEFDESWRLHRKVRVHARLILAGWGGGRGGCTKISNVNSKGAGCQRKRTT